MSPLQGVIAGWLRRVATVADRDRLVVRGSLLLQSWGSRRTPADVDHLLLGDYDEGAARALVDAVLAGSADDDVTFDRANATHEAIWAETSFPGLRSKVIGRRNGAEALLQIDIGHGDPLAAPPVATSIAGAGALLGVRPETMLAWKAHGLVEFGRGQWRAKDLYDLWFLAERIPLDDALVIASLRLAFASRATALSAADRFLFSADWGGSRGSRRRWETFGRRAGIAVPELPHAIARVRQHLLPLFVALAGSGRSSHAMDGAPRDDEEAPEQRDRDDG